MIPAPTCPACRTEPVRRRGDRCEACRPVRPSGKHTSPRIAFHASVEDVARWRSIAEEEGVTLSEWLREAARAWELLGERKDGRLTDDDWRSIVSGE